MSDITAVVQIGNSDDKLTQRQWSGFISLTSNAVYLLSAEVHFEGHSDLTATWQNYCWVFQIPAEKIPKLSRYLGDAARCYAQDSIALTTGTTTFVAPLT